MWEYNYERQRRQPYDRADRKSPEERVVPEVNVPRRELLARAIADLFLKRLEFRLRRAGQIACMLAFGDLPSGPPRDQEVQEVLDAA